MFLFFLSIQTFFFIDRNHFDNPVYSYQGNGKRDEDYLLNNTTQIKNNLHKQNNTNLEKQRIGIAAACCSTDDDDLSSKGKFDHRRLNFLQIKWLFFAGSYEINGELHCLKNREADSTNPNIYHSIDKLEHIYTEIKQKDAKDIGKKLYK